MKKAFDANVSRARPRLRVGALTEAADAAAASLEQPPEEPVAAVSASEPAAPPREPRTRELGPAVKSRAERARAPKPTAVEAVRQAIETKQPARSPAPTFATWSEFDANAEAQAILDIAEAAAPRRAEEIVARATAAVLGTPVAPHEVVAPAAHAAPPAHVVEVQTPAPELPHEDAAEPPAEVRRERLKERLRAVRENPRPEPLPATVAEAGVLAVERIATLQAELHQLREVNLALTQDLEGARRQAEKATEEARLRMDESRRLTAEMEGRVRLLQELERELAALEGERDDALLALQEARQGLQGAHKERAELQSEIARRDQTISECLAEEERLCAELELAREDGISLRRSVDALKTERDTLARQVSELTAERAELLEARKALEAVHRALHHAAR